MSDGSAPMHAGQPELRPLPARTATALAIPGALLRGTRSPARRRIAPAEALELQRRVGNRAARRLARLPEPSNDDIARQFGAVDFAALRTSLQAHTEHVLGHDVTGLRPEFAARIRGAEQALAQSANGGTAITDAQWRTTFNVRSVGGGRWNSNGSPAGMHGWGLAIDINYEGAPYVMHEHGEATLDVLLGPIYHRIAWLMLGRESVIPHQMTQSPARGDAVTRQWATSLTEESDAMQRYFALMNDPAATGWPSALAAARTQWSHLAMGATAPADDAALTAALRAQMAGDYGILGGHPGPTGIDALAVPAPPALAPGVDRPFKGRDPASGYFNLNADLVAALRAQSQMRWGAIDFGGESGDIMHFDIRPFYATKRASAVSALAASSTGPTAAAETPRDAGPVAATEEACPPRDAGAPLVA